MLCEHHKDALIEAAASGVGLADAPASDTRMAALRAHLESCPSCRAAFDEEQSLFAAINSGLHAAANAEIPPSLIPGVRARLDETVAPRLRWVPSLVFASAGVTLALVVFLLARPHHTAPEEAPKQGLVVVPAPTAPATKTNVERISPESTEIATVRVEPSLASRNSTNLHSAASSNPEVLVPSDEREGLARLVAAMNQRSDIAAALLVPAEKRDALLSLEPVQIKDLEIKPLESTETETSDGTGEKH